MIPTPPRSTLFPYTTLFRSLVEEDEPEPVVQEVQDLEVQEEPTEEIEVIESKDEDIKPDIKLEKIEEEPDIPAPPAEIVDYPDVEAGFPGGAAAMKQFLADNIKYPEIAMELGDQGRVFIKFVVNKDGSIEQVKVLRGVSKEIEIEASRVVMKCLNGNLLSQMVNRYVQDAVFQLTLFFNNI